MKYIVISSPHGELPIIFPDVIVSREMLERMARKTAVSGGFIDFSGNGVKCYGESTSLGVTSRRERDASLIQYGFK